MANPEVDELTTFDYVRDILIHEMDLDEKRVNIFNQKFDIPTDDGMFIVLECLPSKIISNRDRQVQDLATGEYQEIQDLNIQEQIVIGIFSKTLEAMRRKEDVLLALNSVYSQQIQERGSFHIRRISPIQDLTVLESAARLYRYDIPVMMLTWHQKIKKIDYYDSFKVEVKADDSGIDKKFDQPVTDPTQ